MLREPTGEVVHGPIVAPFQHDSRFAGEAGSAPAWVKRCSVRGRLGHGQFLADR